MYNHPDSFIILINDLYLNHTSATVCTSSNRQRLLSLILLTFSMENLSFFRISESFQNKVHDPEGRVIP